MFGTWIRWRSWKELPPEPMDVLKIVRGSSTDEHRNDIPRGWYWSFVSDEYRPQNSVLSAAAAMGRGEAANVNWSCVVSNAERVVK